MKALVLDAGNSSSYHVMRSLARHGVEAHLVAGRLCHWHRSRYSSAQLTWPWVKDADESESAFVDHLLRLMAKEKYDLLLSCGDTWTERIYRNFDQFAGRIECATPGPRVSDRVFDKNSASRWAQQAGIPIPRTIFVDDLESVPAAGDALGFPLVVKGQEGSGSSNVRFVLDQPDLLPSYRAVYEMERNLEGMPALQEFVGGPGFLVHMLFWKGEPYAVCCHRKDREYPIGGGVTSAATTVDAPALRDAALSLARSLDWHGLVKMDFVFDPLSGEYKFIEIDPRVSASIDITRAAGVDQVVMLADLVAGKPVEPNLAYKTGVRYRWLFPRDLMVGVAQPRVWLAILPDMFSPRTHFDLGPSDWWPFFYQLGRFVKEKKFLDKAPREMLRRASELRAAYQAAVASGRR